jgi:hypothetical protein
VSALEAVMWAAFAVGGLVVILVLLHVFVTKD